MAIKTEGKMIEKIKEDLMFIGEHLDTLLKKALGNICKTKISITAIVLGIHYSLFFITNTYLVINVVSLMWLLTDIGTIITIEFSVRG